MLPDNNDNNELDYMSKEELNEIFEDIFELPDEDSVKLAYKCHIMCDTAPSK